jgi:ABC-type dipeptide/oligopeptide/nickel transport system permease subunit
VIVVAALTSSVTYTTARSAVAAQPGVRPRVRACSGVPNKRITPRYILPNVIRPVIVMALAVGSKRSSAWGTSCGPRVQHHHLRPVLMAVELAFNLVGGWTREVLDPRLRLRPL